MHHNFFEIVGVEICISEFFGVSIFFERYLKVKLSVIFLRSYIIRIPYIGFQRHPTPRMIKPRICDFSCSSRSKIIAHKASLSFSVNSEVRYNFIILSASNKTLKRHAL